MSQEILISVIVSTYNRKDLIKQCIESIINQLYPKYRYEILIIEGGSTDGTQDIINELSKITLYNLRLIKQIGEGLSNARNLGIKESKGDIIVFIDDDALASPHWLQDYSSIYEMFPDIAAAGGRIEPVFHMDKPKWLSDDLLVALGYLNLSDRETVLSYPDHPFGGNFSVKREQFMSLGGFIEEFKNCNEEKAFFFKLYLNGYKVGYSPKALVYHHIPTLKLRRIFFIKRGIKQGISNIRVTSKFNPSGIPLLKEELSHLLFDGLVIIGNALFYRNRLSFAQVYYLCIRWGQILGIVMRRFEKNEYRSHSHSNETS